MRIFILIMTLAFSALADEATRKADPNLRTRTPIKAVEADHLMSGTSDDRFKADPTKYQALDARRCELEPDFPGCAELRASQEADAEDTGEGEN